MSEPTKILPFVRAALPAVAAITPKFAGFPRFAQEFGRGPMKLRPVLGFAMPGGLPDDRSRR